MAAVYVKINGVDWSHKIAEITPVVRENKKSAANVKGEIRILKPRSTRLSNSLQIHFPYLILEDMETLKGIAQISVTVNIDHNMDMPKGDMVVMEFNRQVVKSLDGILYNVTITLSFSSFTTSSTGLTAINPHTYTSGSVTAWVG